MLTVTQVGLEQNNSTFNNPAIYTYTYDSVLLQDTPVSAVYVVYAAADCMVAQHCSSGARRCVVTV